MTEPSFTVQKQPQAYTLLETVEIKPAPRVCRGSRYGLCLARPPRESVLTEVHGVQWVQCQRVEHLQVMHEFWWEGNQEHGLGYADVRWTHQPAQLYFFGRQLCRLGNQRSTGQTRGKVFTQAFFPEPALTALRILLRTAGKLTGSAKVRLV